MDASFLISAFRENQYPLPDRPEIAFAGRSNVGKSSLINILANRKGLAKTSSRPGRTQSINFFGVNDLLYLVDLPGYGFARVPLQVKKSWRQMVETYLSKRPNLKAVVVILDIRRDPNSGDINLLEWLRQYQIDAIIVLTKADKVSRQLVKSRTSLIERQLGKNSAIGLNVFSAKTRQGRQEIWQMIKQVTGCDLQVQG